MLSPALHQMKFEKLPAEVRDLEPSNTTTNWTLVYESSQIRSAIYEVLLVREDPLPVCSPRPKHVVGRALTPESFLAILHLNKHINTEASPIFYSKNTFAFGNGPYGSTTKPNAHGMKAFLQRVPPKHIACIQHAVLEIYSRQILTPVPRPARTWRYCDTGLGTLHDVANLHFISRALGEFEMTNPTQLLTGHRQRKTFQKSSMCRVPT